ncbi:SDR family NAD(P)-dependent oxidoreductase [Bosea lathyri]|uniref:NAD(P)-dependent dehydrogenase, short-chain alcohol dehydrogenase family n=1 Tax=Bosea lathyri TaxID=1036778 RepID=A0A1H5S4N5_9HYPH|nr:SDR family NAD(P)-dependent oxidoreductase [Bosea lathyri]SEF45562.1 NAD(P)-dependent dehydrogenase, short-chain alcohol dehydrogenase family [Bosea lathyri]
MSSLKDKVALITGAGTGIGAVAAGLFARKGARVVVAEINAEQGRAVVEQIRAEGFEAEFVQTDVTDAESVQRCIAKAVATFGKLDVIYNNAGGSSMRDGDVTRVEVDEFWRAIKLDLFGTWLVCHYGIPEIIKAGGGAVVNATSVVALMGWPGKDAYTAAKGAITALTRSMAVEFAPHHVRVNAVAPGTTRTPRVVAQLAQLETTQKLTAAHLLGMVEPLDVANAALFLASDASARTTGHILAVDSGLSIS